MHGNGHPLICHVVLGLFNCQALRDKATPPVHPAANIDTDNKSHSTHIVQFALQPNAIIAICNPRAPKTNRKTLYLKAFIDFQSWHEDCSMNRIPSMPSEVAAMNSTLILLNAVALVVLVVFHFQPVTTSSEQIADVAGTYEKPLKVLPQRAVMSGNAHLSPQLAAEQAAAIQNSQDERWAF